MMSRAEAVLTAVASMVAAQEVVTRVAGVAGASAREAVRATGATAAVTA